MLTKEKVWNVELLQGKDFFSTVPWPIEYINHAHKRR